MMEGLLCPKLREQNRLLNEEVEALKEIVRLKDELLVRKQDQVDTLCAYLDRFKPNRAGIF